MTPLLTTHLWQSTFFAVAAALLTLAFRGNQAQVRYWLWLSASLKFLVPFALLMGVGSLLETPAARQIATRITTTPAIAYTIEQFNEPLFPGRLPAAAPAVGAIHWIPVAIIGPWLCGFLVIALIRFRSWLRVRRAVRASTPIDIPAPVEVRVSPGLLEPGVVGLRRPILLLPDGILERLTPSELKAVLAHELYYVRRHDNLFAAIHMIVEAIFWFHPLVWWIGARLVEERERACDEEVLSLGNQPDVYADAILNVCKLYVESPLACVSGVAGAGIRRRIEAIMANRRLAGLNRAKKFLLASAGAVALAGPLVVGLVIGVGNSPVIRAQSPAPEFAQTAKPASSSPIQMALVPVVHAQQPAKSAAQVPTPITAVPREFEVASVKPSGTRPADGGGRKGGGVGCPESFKIDPGRVDIGCATLVTLIAHAFRIPPYRVTGPDWIGRQGPRFDIEAKFASDASENQVPEMLQALLVERFRLDAHRGNKEQEVYALVVAKGGLKVKDAARQADVASLDVAEGPNAPPSTITDVGGLQTRTTRAPNADGMGYMTTRSNPRIGTVRQTDGPNFTTHLEAPSTTIEGLADLLSPVGFLLDIVDMTRLQGRYQVVLDFSLSGAFAAAAAIPPPGGDPTALDNARTDMQYAILNGLNEGLLKLGLQLERRRGTVETLVVDHLDKTPTGN